MIAHAGKTSGDGLPRLRSKLARHVDPFWLEIPKSKKAPAHLDHALAAGRS